MRGCLGIHRMGFFDLNIPYTESNKQNSTTAKSNRLKLAVKAMEFGYTGVAYNRTITGVMSELDRCSISLFPLASVLKVSPSLSSSVNLHRRLLDVPTSTAFRQYTRLTVVVDNPAQGSVLNSGNPVLKTYDIVAVRPLKQESFDQACKNYEVDIIAIDFLENRFRLKQPLIKAAIERGVYFEITYSALIMDAQLRRQMISNAKLLVDWTRGKNLIFSSAAPSVTELRGPHDVANLASLLGFSMERAKASVSKTCRSLLINALRKKKFHKEAIKVERMTPAEQFDIEEAGFDDWLKWDPISSGEGDLQLDDIAKSFACSANNSKTVKTTDFVTIIDNSPSNGTKEISEPNDSGKNLSATPNTEKSITVNELPLDSELDHPPEKDQTSMMETLEKGHQSNFSSTTEIVEAKIEVPKAISEENVTCEDHSSIQCEVANDISFDAHIGPPIVALNEVNVDSDAESKGALSLTFSDAFLHEKLLGEDMRVIEDVAISPVSSSLPSSSVSVHAVVAEEHVSEIGRDVSVAPVDTLASLRYNVELQTCDNLVIREPLEDVLMEDRMEFKEHSGTRCLSEHESSSERLNRKRRSSRSISFPFKRFLKPSHFKKKARKLKTKSKFL